MLLCITKSHAEPNIGYNLFNLLNDYILQGRKLLKAPPYVLYHTLYTDLILKSITYDAKIIYKIFHNRLCKHPNHLIKTLPLPKYLKILRYS